jgi:2',3'-cyclic-nucleotide 2'-phosphodiesterase (5'-nucleotidase family)
MTASTRVDVMIEMDGSTGQGLVDIAFMNAIGFDASAIGNHEFDLGSDFFAGVIADKAYSPGADFPFLSANLDFSQSLSLDPLFTSDILEDSAFKWQSLPKISRATIVKVNGQSIGILGVTPPNLQIISTPTGVTVIGPDDVSNIEGLASTLQPTVDDLMGLGINKVILISHLKSFASNRELATNLTGVDVIIAGGDETILANADDVLRGSDVADDEYPVLTYGRDGYPVVIVSTKGEYQYVGQLTIQFNSQGRVIPNFDENSNGPISTGTSFVD